jgi:hypothetical protein
MFTYPLTLDDAIQAFVKYGKTHNSQVEFTDPALNQFYADEALGLCTINFKTNTTNRYIGGQGDSTLEITYLDPELEFVRRLGS